MRLLRIPIVKDAIPYLVACVALAIVAYLLMPLASTIPLTLLILIAFFFRDPERKPPHLPSALISPADGRIIEINEVFEEKFLNDVSQARDLEAMFQKGITQVVTCVASSFTEEQRIIQALKDAGLISSAGHVAVNRHGQLSCQ